MIDLMLIAGSALCVLSIVAAIVAVSQTRAPRGAAILLMLGIIVLLIGAKMDAKAMNPANMVGAWKRLFAGEISLRMPEAPAEGGASDPASTGADAAPATPSTEAPAASQ
ncbi:hypothetical protein [Paracoccus aminophilus]|uniref:Uncharacterized protein n=1 Tax=Paracoccus aminophilus JCM 7686 TaxID=1367847 RepID=S5XK07_PARAH|nr:hypothetical protein [Paracoccus aminophilus]AGT07514.1 hypothetical protein JCM7686_0405 [Paracoccus aminophilus JCM 7686]